MAKLVMYNGNEESSIPCSNWSILNKGICYEIIWEENFEDQTLYRLKGIDGTFNSNWFDCIPTFLALSNDIPTAGSFLRNFSKLENQYWKQISYSSRILNVEKFSKNVYKVYTDFIIYIVEVV